MKIYLAGFGHHLPKNKAFAKKIAAMGVRFMFSYFYYDKRRFKWIMNDRKWRRKQKEQE